jgi:flagellar hook protein FlgE
MHGMIDFSTPLAGLNTAASTVTRAASNIARSGFSGDTVDLSQEMVNLMQGQNDFEANTKVIKTEDQMTRGLLDIVA